MNIEFSIKCLKDYIEKEKFRGFDPYDALNSPILKSLCFHRKFMRIFFTQIMKRSPFNLRAVLAIRKSYNPKGIGLFLWGYSKLYHVEKRPEYLEKIDFFLDLINKLKSDGYSGNCWGYNFDWQSRAFYLPKYTPTVVNSSFIGHALIDAYKYTGKQEALKMAISIKNFILNDLNRLEENSSLCFSYSPLDKVFVHNANLLGASLLIRLYRYIKEIELKKTALLALAYSMNHQNEDGSWYYAETDFQNWIDSFHTGFNLQSILYFLEEAYGKEYRKGFEKGIDFYTQYFFLKNGTPKYFHDKRYPIDIHSAAQAIVFLSRIGEKYKNHTQKILFWMIENMQDKKGYFYFQKGRFFTNKIAYMRWSQAWAFHALTEYLFYESEDKNANPRNS